MSRKLFQFRLRTLFFVMTTICVGFGPTSRIIYFRQQAAFHHRLVEQQLNRANRIAANSPARRSEALLKNAQHHLIIATACDYASFHPWLNVADAQVIVSRSYSVSPSESTEYR